VSIEDISKGILEGGITDVTIRRYTENDAKNTCNRWSIKDKRIN